MRSILPPDGYARRDVPRPFGLRRGDALSTRLQNCRSPITLTGRPCAARRLISNNFVPPTFPAICNAFGRPRTSTSDVGPGLDTTIAPAFFAAEIASLRG